MKYNLTSWMIQIINENTVKKYKSEEICVVIQHYCVHISNHHIIIKLINWFFYSALPLITSVIAQLIKASPVPYGTRKFTRASPLLLS